MLLLIKSEILYPQCFNVRLNPHVLVGVNINGKKYMAAKAVHLWTTFWPSTNEANILVAVTYMESFFNLHPKHQ